MVKCNGTNLQVTFKKLLLLTYSSFHTQAWKSAFCCEISNLVFWKGNHILQINLKLTTEVDYFKVKLRQCQIEISRDFLNDLQKGGKKKDSCFVTGAQPDLKKYTKIQWYLMVHSSSLQSVEIENKNTLKLR